MNKLIHLVEMRYICMVLCSGVSTDEFKGIMTQTKKNVTCKNCIKIIKKNSDNPFELNG